MPSVGHPVGHHRCLLAELHSVEWLKALGAPLDRHADATPPELLQALLHIFAAEPSVGMRILVDRQTALVSLQVRQRQLSDLALRASHRPCVTASGFVGRRC